jgi:hypothetical protein
VLCGEHRRNLERAGTKTVVRTLFDTAAKRAYRLLIRPNGPEHTGVTREGRMTVRFFPGSKRQKTSLIQGFLSQHHVAHTLAMPEEYQSKTFHLGTDPAVEVDGRLFVDPNVDALKKILNVE